MAVVEVEFPGNLSQVASLAALRALPSSFIDDGAAYLVSNAGLFVFDPGSTAADDNTSVIKPSDRTPLQAGRWLLSGTGLFATNSSLGAAIEAATSPLRNLSGIAFQQDGAGAVQRTALDKARESLSVKDYGAKGDGITNDTVAFKNCYNACVTQKKAMRVPAGIYRAWLMITDSNFVIDGDGSGCTTIKLPDGAQHTIPDNNAGNGPMVTGTPCVLDFGNIGTGNDATARSGAHISGLTLDGNKANTAPPTLDLFGWGMVFTKYSGVSYDDIVAVDCHAGGIGTFINSNYHRGTNWQASRCGFNLGHPGFDVNSSKYSVWQGVVDACREGARLLDNCRNNSLDVSIASCDRTGFIYGNQITGAPGTGNFSENNDVMVRVDGGCSIAGVQVGAKCASGTITATIANVAGTGVHEVKQANTADNPRGIHYQISTIRGGRGSCIVGGDSGVWAITTIDDGGQVPAGSLFAVDVFGDRNVLQVTYQDSNTKLRGVQFNAGSDVNRLISYTYGNSVQPIQDMGAGNFIAVPDNGWVAATGTPSKATFAAAPAGTVSAAYVQSEAQSSRDRIATLEGQLLAVRQALAKAGITDA